MLEAVSFLGSSLALILLAAGPALAGEFSEPFVPRGATSLNAGQPCAVDNDYGAGRCRQVPGYTLVCVSIDRTCSYPTEDGAAPGQRASLDGQCYVCQHGQGWKQC